MQLTPTGQTLTTSWRAHTFVLVRASCVCLWRSGRLHRGWSEQCVLTAACPAAGPPGLNDAVVCYTITPGLSSWGRVVFISFVLFVTTPVGAPRTNKLTDACPGDSGEAHARLPVRLCVRSDCSRCALWGAWSCCSPASAADFNSAGLLSTLTVLVCCWLQQRWSSPRWRRWSAVRTPDRRAPLRHRHWTCVM